MLSFAEIHLEIAKKLKSDSTVIPVGSTDLLRTVHQTAKKVVDWDEVLRRKASKTVTEDCHPFKVQGTKALQSKRLQEALALYTKFIRICHRLPYQEAEAKSKMVCQGYTSRSLVFYRSVNQLGSHLRQSSDTH